MVTVKIEYEGKELTQGQFNRIEKNVLNYFLSLWNDIRESVYSIRKKDPRLIKSEISLVFIGADSLSRFREIIVSNEEEKSNEVRFREWFDEYVFNDGNEVYKKYKKEINCNSFIAWKLRNSLLHFYAFPEDEYITFATLENEQRKDLRRLARQASGKELRVISPYRFIEAVISGFLMQTETIKKLLEGTDDLGKEIYIRGIVKCHHILKSAGSTFIPIERLENLIKAGKSM